MQVEDAKAVEGLLSARDRQDGPQGGRDETQDRNALGAHDPQGLGHADGADIHDPDLGASAQGHEGVARPARAQRRQAEDHVVRTDVEHIHEAAQHGRAIAPARDDALGPPGAA